MADRVVKKAWVTKWAMTAGIIEVNNAKVIDEKYLSSGQGIFVGIIDWYPTQEEAQARYQRMLASKLQTVNKQAKVISEKLGQTCKVVSYKDVFR